MQAYSVRIHGSLNHTEGANNGTFAACGIIK